MQIKWRKKWSEWDGVVIFGPCLFESGWQKKKNPHPLVHVLMQSPRNISQHSISTNTSFSCECVLKRGRVTETLWKAAWPEAPQHYLPLGDWDERQSNMAWGHCEERERQREGGDDKPQSLEKHTNYTTNQSVQLMNNHSITSLSSLSSLTIPLLKNGNKQQVLVKSSIYAVFMLTYKKSYGD